MEELIEAQQKQLEAIKKLFDSQIEIMKMLSELLLKISNRK